MTASMLTSGLGIIASWAVTAKSPIPDDVIDRRLWYIEWGKELHMAIEDFWNHLRGAAGAFARATSEDVTWLNRESVRDFDPNDFRFLPEDQRTALATGVDRFLAVANRVPDDAEPTRSQIDQGRTAFGEILAILQPHRFWDAESFRTQTLIEPELRGKLPRWVTGISCETFTDLDGDPAIRIWVDVTDKATDKGKIEKEGDSIDRAVESAYRRIGGQLWTSIRFRSPDAFLRREGGAA